MREDVWLLVVTAASALLGSVMSLHPPTKRTHKVAYAIGFVVLGVLGVVLGVQQSNETAAASKRANDAQSQLRNTIAQLQASSAKLEHQTKEVARVQQLNTQLQEQLLAESRDIADLSKAALENITGKDAYAYLAPQIHASTADRIPLAAVNGGEHILTGVTARVMRTDTARQMQEDSSDADMEIAIGTLYPGEVRLLPGRFVRPVPDTETGVATYWIHISAQNGLISEGLSFRRARTGQRPWAYWMKVERIAYKNTATGVVWRTSPLIYREWSDVQK